MGAEAVCILRYKGKKTPGKAFLETKELIVRGERRLVIPHATITRVDASEGILRIAFDGGNAELEIGVAADKWAEKIRNPRSLVDKLGVKPGMRVSIVGLDDVELISLVRNKTEDFHSGAAHADSDIIFFGALVAQTWNGFRPYAANLNPTEPSG